MRSLLKYIITFAVLIQISNADDLKGKISGHITDEDTGEPIIGANVIATGTSFGAATDLEGKYSILNLNPGVYSLTVTMIGYARTDIHDVNVRQRVETTVNAVLPVEIIRSGGSDVVQAHSISSLPTYLPSYADSVYMAADTSKRGKYTVPVYVVNSTETAWRIPTIDWTAWITPVVSKGGESFKYIEGRSAFCGNSAFGSTLPANSYEIYRQPLRIPESSTDSIQYTLRLTEPIRKHEDGKFLHISSSQYPGTISDHDIEQTRWGRDHIASLSQQELWDLLHDKIDIPMKYELKAKLGAIPRISLYQDLRWLRGFDKLKYRFYLHRYGDQKARKWFLRAFEARIKLYYMNRLAKDLDLKNYSLKDQHAYDHQMVRLMKDQLINENRQATKYSQQAELLRAEGLTSKNEYLRASAVRGILQPSEEYDRFELLYDLVKTDPSMLVKTHALKTISNRQVVPTGDTLKSLLNEVATFGNPELRNVGYYLLPQDGDSSMQRFVESYVHKQIRIETERNKPLLMFKLSVLNSLSQESIQLLNEYADASNVEIRRYIAYAVVEHLEKLFKSNLESTSNSGDLISIMARLSLDDELRVQRDALGVYRFGLHDERIMNILLLAQDDMKSDFPNDIAKKIRKHRIRYQN